MARPKPYWDVRPRYSPGSPAALYDDRLIKDIVWSERTHYQGALEGLYGPEQQARAERLGLRGIVVLTYERRGRWDCYDEVTGEHYSKPFPEKMSKDGWVTWRDLEPGVQRALQKADPVLAKEIERDARPFWFSARNHEVDFIMGPGTYEAPVSPPGFIWEPIIETKE